MFGFYNIKNKLLNFYLIREYYSGDIFHRIIFLIILKYLKHPESVDSDTYYIFFIGKY